MDPIADTLAGARSRLLGAWSGTGVCGHLSSSALSTATAALACALSEDDGHRRLAAGARRWLCEHQNGDGGWGDTADSPSNISTTTVVWAALGLAGADEGPAAAASARAEAWLARACGELEPPALARAIRALYGRDHTFSVPILMTCALAGRLGPDGWRRVPALPFELAACPYAWFRWLRLRTVSYALPALIAIGQARHHHRPSRNPLARWLRHATRRRTLRILQEIQPASGGFLEAAPLTSFVAMALLSMGLGGHPVARACLGFLEATVRGDGSWPIDINLDTWLTTLSLGALAGEGDPEMRERAGAWLLRQQYRREHPYTRAAPGGWAWTDLSGGVPDADDTAGALLALRQVGGELEPRRDAAALGVGWLLDLQNGDGGIPTFCRGWGRLPFDRSSPDLTAHALRAWTAWRDELPGALRTRAGRAAAAAVRYLLGSQRPDGAWVPLWFGNQREPREENPLYGTTRVLRAAAAVRCEGELEAAWLDAGHRALRWLLGAQHGDGGFGAGPGVPPSVEETALAVEALAAWQLGRGDDERARAATERGSRWLADATARGTRFEPAPIGLYFARLWYSERLYPVIFTVSALTLARRLQVRA